MKRYYILLLAVCSLGSLPAQDLTTTGAPAEKLPPTEPTGVKLTPDFQPPVIVSSRFASDYPNTRAVWKEEDDNIYSAEYRDETSNMGRIVRYDNSGTVLTVDNEMHNDAYPAAIGTYYIKHYPGEKYAIWQREDASGNKTYYANRESGKVWFDKEGKPLYQQPQKPAKRKGGKTGKSQVTMLTDNDL